MEFVLDFSGFDATGLNPLPTVIDVFLNGGWLVVLVVVLSAAWIQYLEDIRLKYLYGQAYVLLAIDVPKPTEDLMSLKAVEQIFAHLAGTHGKGTLWERYGKGKNQESFSLEIVSIEGYIQYLIHTPVKHRDLVEAAIYAQYPDAEITEVPDYTGTVPTDYPSETHDLWGTSYELEKKEAYPIRTYPAFEHTLPGVFADPLASLLEIISKLGPGEQVWLQLVITPIASKEWRETGENVVRKIIGAKVKEKKNIGGQLYGLGRGIYDTTIASIETLEPEQKKAKDELYSHFMQLPPSEKLVVEAIGMKIAKLGFATKFRHVYIAEKPVFTKDRGAQAISSAMKNFTAQDMNGFKSNNLVKTKVHYLFTKQRLAFRQRNVLRNFRMRRKGRGFVLNTEELATLYHFPTLTVKAPLVKKIEAKRGEPPVSLPVERPSLRPTASLPREAPGSVPAVQTGVAPPPAGETGAPAPPTNLPV